jgi:cobalt transporter subunit CbtB
MNNFHSSTIAAAPSRVRVSTVLQLAAAFFLGAVIMYGTGFVQTSPVHNAAHDMRHAQGFPCH